MEYCNNVMGPPESYSMWNQRSKLCPNSSSGRAGVAHDSLCAVLREGDFPLYVQSCDELCSWFHALDHTNYARWFPVHVRDMVQLAQQNPKVHAEFMKENFVALAKVS